MGKAGECGPGGSLYAVLALKNCDTYTITFGAFFGQKIPDANGIGVPVPVPPTGTARGPGLPQTFYSSRFSCVSPMGASGQLAQQIAPLTWRQVVIPNDGFVFGGDW